MKVTPALVIGLWDYLEGVYGSARVDKSNSRLMEAAGSFLDLIGVQNREIFLAHYCTTILDKIYTPFEVGVEGGSWSLWSQICVAVHEHQHVWQWRREGLSFALGYLAKKSARASWEAEAYRCNVELHYWRHGVLPSIDWYASKLKHYGCGEEEVQFVKRFLLMCCPVIASGGIVSHASQTAISWLEGHR